MHFTRMGVLRRAPRGAGDRPGRGLLRLRRARQALPRRPLGALLRERRPRPRRARRDAAAAQAKELDFYTNWSYAHPRSIELAARIAGLAPGNLNRVFFTSGGSEAVESAWKLAKAYHRARGETNRHKLISRKLAYHGTSMGALTATGLTPLREPVRAAHPGRHPRAEHQLLPLAGGPRPAVGGRRDRGGDRVRGRRHGRGGDPRAGAERRRLLRPPGRLLPARARDLRPPRRAADLRRGDLLVGAPRPLVRLRALRLPAGHHHDGQGHHLGLRADGRGDRLRPHRRAVPARHGGLQPRLHLRRASRRLRRRAGQHRRDGARGAVRARARERRRRSARCSRACATCRSSATSAAPATSRRSSSSRTRRPRRPSTTRSPSSCCAASSRASSTGAA